MKKLTETWKQKKPLIGFNRTSDSGVKLANTGTKRLGRVVITSSNRSRNSATRLANKSPMMKSSSGSCSLNTSASPDYSISSSFALDLGADVIDTVDSLEAAAMCQANSKIPRSVSHQNQSAAVRTPTRQTQRRGNISGIQGKRKNSRSRKSVVTKASLFGDVSGNSVLSDSFTPTHSPRDKKRKGSGREGRKSMCSTENAPPALSGQKSRLLCQASPSPDLCTVTNQQSCKLHKNGSPTSSSASLSAKPKSTNRAANAVAGHQHKEVEDEAEIETDISPVLTVSRSTSKGQDTYINMTNSRENRHHDSALKPGSSRLAKEPCSVLRSGRRQNEILNHPSETCHTGVSSTVTTAISLEQNTKLGDTNGDEQKDLASNRAQTVSAESKSVHAKSSTQASQNHCKEIRSDRFTVLKSGKQKDTFKHSGPTTSSPTSASLLTSAATKAAMSASAVTQSSDQVSLKDSVYLTKASVSSVSSSSSLAYFPQDLAMLSEGKEKAKGPQAKSLAQNSSNVIHTRLHSQNTECKESENASNTKAVLETTDQPSARAENLSGDSLSLSSWGLPGPVLEAYHSQGIMAMFPWQAECLTTGSVLGGGNLVYSAPTSAGKTMVAELLMLKRVLETRRKALFILPFVSVTREKMVSLQRLYQDAGVRVGGFMGSHSHAGGFRSLDVAVCTIEKGNGLINRLMEEDRIDELGVVVIDELHMVGDSNRGYLLELLLTKISYMAHKSRESSKAPIQLIGMSATLPNLNLLASWLDANLYHTDFRPVPLTEHVKVGTTIYDQSMVKIRDIEVKATFQGDEDHIIPLCLETVMGGHSVLIFCPTKVWCEKMAERIAREFYRIMKNPTALAAYTGETGFVKASEMVRLPIDQSSLRNVLEQLGRSPVGMDPMLGKVVQYGVAYHHAGLTFDERDIIEGAFRQGLVKILVATSTLSSGVNLPARRVIVRSPMFGGRVMDTLSYKQMAGRAGRKGVDTEGECVLVCKEGEKKVAQNLLKTDLPPVTSCLQSKGDGAQLSRSMKRAILEVVVSGVASTPRDVVRYVACTLLSASLPPDDSSTATLITSCLAFLEDNEFVTLHTVKDSDSQDIEKYQPTQLGSAVLASSMSPDEGLAVFAELQKARQCFVLANELHVIYLVTPIYSQEISGSLDWYHFYCLWEKLSPDMRLVAKTVGVEEGFLAKAITGRIPTRTAAQAKAVAVHRRFYTALALHDLVQEVPLMDVVTKFGCNKGQLQSLMQSAATFAGMVTVFCARLGWTNLELLLSQFQQRLTLGVTRELCDLVRIPLLTGTMARMLFNAGYQTVASVAHASPEDVEIVFRKASPFQSTKKQEGESDWDMEQRRKAQCVWLAGRKGVTELEAAIAITDEAKTIIQQELGVQINWQGGAADISVVAEGSENLSASRTVLKDSRDLSAVSRESPQLNSRNSSVSSKVSPSASMLRTATDSVYSSETSPSLSKRKRKSAGEGGVFQTPVTIKQSRKSLSCRSTSKRNSGGGTGVKSPPSGGRTENKTGLKNAHSPKDVSFFGQVVVSPPASLRKLTQTTRSPLAADPVARLETGTCYRSVSTPKTSVHDTCGVRLFSKHQDTDKAQHVQVHMKSHQGSACVGEVNQDIDKAQQDPAVTEPRQSSLCVDKMKDVEEKMSDSSQHALTRMKSVKSSSTTERKSNSQNNKQHELYPVCASNGEAFSDTSVQQNQNGGTKDSENKFGIVHENFIVHNEKKESDAKNKQYRNDTDVTHPKPFKECISEASGLQLCQSSTLKSQVLDAVNVRSVISEQGSGVNSGTKTSKEIPETEPEKTNVITSMPDLGEDEDAYNCFDDSLILNTQTNNLLSGRLSDSTSVSDKSFENATASTPLEQSHTSKVAMKHKNTCNSEERCTEDSDKPASSVWCHAVDTQSANTLKELCPHQIISKVNKPSALVAEPEVVVVNPPAHKYEQITPVPVLEQDNLLDDLFGSSFVSLPVSNENQKQVSHTQQIPQKEMVMINMNQDRAELEQPQSRDNLVPDIHCDSEDDTSAELIAASNYERLEYMEDGMIEDSENMSYQELGISGGSGHLVCVDRDPDEREEGRDGWEMAKLTEGLGQKSAVEYNVQEDLAIAMNMSESFSSTLPGLVPKMSDVNGVAGGSLVREKESTGYGRDNDGFSNSFTASMMEKAFADDSFCNPAEEKHPNRPNKSTTQKNQTAERTSGTTGKNSTIRASSSQKDSSKPDLALEKSNQCKVKRKRNSSNSQKSKRNSSECISSPSDGELVPPTPEECSASGSSPCVRRTPMRACRTRGEAAHLPSQAAAGSLLDETKKRKPQENQKTSQKSQSSRKTVGSSKHSDGDRNKPVTQSNHLSSSYSVNRCLDLEKTSMNDQAAEAHGSDHVENEVLQEADTPPLTQNSLCVIDVCSNADLFATFVEEWRGQSVYAISVACEKKPSPVLPGGGIGGNFIQGKSNRMPQPGPPSVQGVEIPGDEERTIVGLSVSWAGHDAYYISLLANDTDTDVSLDDTLAAPPCTQSISQEQRICMVSKILQLTKTDKHAPHTVIAYDTKSAYSVLARGLGVVFGRCNDPQIANWLLDPGAREKTLHSMVTNFLPGDLPLLEGIGGGVGYGSLGLTVRNPGSGRMRAVVESIIARRLLDYLWSQLCKAGLDTAFTQTEMPSVLTMARMELNGFGFSEEECESQRNLMMARLSALEQEAYTLAGHPFSLTSTDDISQVLYLELQLPINGDPSAVKSIRTLGPNRRAPRGRQKSAFSTSKDILEKLKAYHPLPAIILEWRRISSALTKHVYPLQKEKVFNQRAGVCRIFSECQMHTATGRVSMMEPNLQNVPKDFDIMLPDVIGESPPTAPIAGNLGKKAGTTRLQAMRGIIPQSARVTDPSKAKHIAVSMRHAFVPFHGGVILAADYSQLELRVIAHLSGDRKLISILNNDGDVFKLIAAQWKNTMPEAVTAQERQHAKQICYGMLYGIGAKALGEQIGVDENDAAVFMESFKAKYTGMRSYLRKTVEGCRENGYVSTVTGRRRYLPAIKDTNPHAKAQAERQAVNTTVQGSAADIVKAAMNRIDGELVHVFPDTRFPHRHFHAEAGQPRGAFLVLQLHDELIYEVSRSEVTKVASIVKQCMETTTQLSVRLPVKVKVGPSWGHLEDMEM